MMMMMVVVAVVFGEVTGKSVAAQS